MVADVVPFAERLGAVLLVASVAMRTTRLFTRSATIVAAAGIVAIAFLAIPISRLTVLAYIFSVIGPLGAASLVLLTVAVMDVLAPVAAFSIRLRTTPLAATVLIAASVFYPLVLGIGRFDPYSLGFSGVILSIGLGAVLVIAVLMRSTAMAIWLAVGLALFLVDAYSSRNLLDYLFDPIAVPVAIVTLVSARISRLRQPGGQPAMSAKAATTSS